MKKFTAIFFTVFLNLALLSCTPATLQDETQEPQACCGDEGPILPPPPPPPPNGNIGG